MFCIYDKLLDIGSRSSYITIAVENTFLVGINLFKEALLEMRGRLISLAHLPTKKIRHIFEELFL